MAKGETHAFIFSTSHILIQHLCLWWNYIQGYFFAVNHLASFLCITQSLDAEKNVHRRVSTSTQVFSSIFLSDCKYRKATQAGHSAAAAHFLLLFVSECEDEGELHIQAPPPPAPPPAVLLKPHTAASPGFFQAATNLKSSKLCVWYKRISLSWNHRETTECLWGTSQCAAFWKHLITSHLS